MGINRSGYYKWKARQGQLNRYEKDRALLTELLQAAHEKHPSHGYHRLADDVFQETGWVFSHHLAHQCCKAAGIRSKARKYRHKSPGEESVKFPNEVRGCWNATAPLQIMVSDMTEFRVNGTVWEWTLLLDTFNKNLSLAAPKTILFTTFVNNTVNAIAKILITTPTINVAYS